MRTNLCTIVVMVLIVAGGCSVPDYLPKTSGIDVNPHGSYIKVTRVKGPNVKGELLAVDTTALIILADSNKQKVMKYVPLSEIKNVTLRYARSKHYWWTMVVYTALCATHGWYAMITVPLNLIVTFAVSLSAENDFRYTKDDISYVELRMFARFPGKIPANIILSDNRLNLQ